MTNHNEPPICCAHLTVRYFSAQNKDGTHSGHWFCEDCHQEFTVMESASKALECPTEPVGLGVRKERCLDGADSAQPCEISAVKNDGGQAQYVPEHRYMGDASIRKDEAVGVTATPSPEISGASPLGVCSEIRDNDLLNAAIKNITTIAYHKDATYEIGARAGEVISYLTASQKPVSGCCSCCGCGSPYHFLHCNKNPDKDLTVKMPDQPVEYTLDDFKCGRVRIDFRNSTIKEIHQLCAICKALFPDQDTPAYTFGGAYFCNAHRWFTGGPHNLIGNKFDVCRVEQIKLTTPERE